MLSEYETGLLGRVDAVSGRLHGCRPGCRHITPFGSPIAADPGPHFGLGAVFRALDLIDNTAVAVAAIGEIAGLGRMLPDHHPLAAVCLITPHPGILRRRSVITHLGGANCFKGKALNATRQIGNRAAAATLAAMTTRPNTVRPGSGYPSVLAQPGSWRTAKISKLGCR